MLIRIAAKHRDNPRLAVRGKRVSLVEEPPKFGNLGTIRDPLPYRLVFLGGDFVLVRVPRIHKCLPELRVVEVG